MMHMHNGMKNVKRHILTVISLARQACSARSSRIWKLFQRHIDTILTSHELNFRATVLYRSAFIAPNIKKSQLLNDDKHPFEVFGLLKDFLLEHRQGSIKIQCSVYIDRLLRTHNWDTDTFDLYSMNRCQQLHPFACLVSKTSSKSCTYSTFGIEVTTDDLSKHVYIQKIGRKKSASQLLSSLRASLYC